MNFKSGNEINKLKPAGKLLLLVLLGINLTSCLMSEYTRTMPVEIMKPGVFTIPENIRTVAILNREILKSDSIPFLYFDATKMLSDTLIKRQRLSNKCLDALAAFLREEKYFGEVRNFRDSLNNLLSADNYMINQDELFRNTKADLCIILNKCSFAVSSVGNFGNVVVNNASLSWTLAFKNDSLTYLYNQNDTLVYDDSSLPNTLNVQKRINNSLDNSSVYLGRTFGAKIIPTWLKVERLYYKSNNPDMLKAEKFALDNDWLKAAEIWNKQTKNRNAKIAAKASFNMALACEMEGKTDAAIDWLVQSYSGLTVDGEEHRENCKRYIGVLALRKKEIEKLEKQVRNQPLLPVAPN